MKNIINSAKSYIRNTNHMIWVPCFLLSGLSILLLFGIMGTGHTTHLRITERNIYIQAVSVVLGVVSAVVISLIDYRDLARLWKIYAPVCYALLMLTFIIGVGAPGRPADRRWLVFPSVGISLQPAELLRVAFILMFAYHIYKLGEKLNHPLHLIGLIAHGSVPVLLVHLQGDDGSALIFAVIMVCMLFAAGLGWKYIVSAATLVAVSLPLLWNFVLNDFQRQRILAIYYGSGGDTEGIFFQQHRAITALAIGGHGGTGVFAAEHVYVPEMHNDFIFAFLGESMGFVGSALTIAVMLILWFKILRCAARSTDMLGYMICIGVFAMLAFQGVINIGMNIGVLPVIGNTLPFISYGGSSVLTSYMGTGLVLSVSMHSAKTMFGQNE